MKPNHREISAAAAMTSPFITSLTTFHRLFVLFYLGMNHTLPIVWTITLPIVWTITLRRETEMVP